MSESKLIVTCDRGTFSCEVRINGVCVAQFSGRKCNEKGYACAFRIQQEILRAFSKPSHTTEAIE